MAAASSAASAHGAESAWRWRPSRPLLLARPSRATAPRAAVWPVRRLILLLGRDLRPACSPPRRARSSTTTRTAARSPRASTATSSWAAPRRGAARHRAVRARLRRRAAQRPRRALRRQRRGRRNGATSGGGAGSVENVAAPAVGGGTGGGGTAAVTAPAARAPTSNGEGRTTRRRPSPSTASGWPTPPRPRSPRQPSGPDVPAWALSWSPRAADRLDRRRDVHPRRRLLPLHPPARRGRRRGAGTDLRQGAPALGDRAASVARPGSPPSRVPQGALGRPEAPARPTGSSPGAKALTSTASSLVAGVDPGRSVAR